MRIGIDFDNTIVEYGDIFTKQACRLGWIKPSAKKTKQDVRELIKKLPDGEMKWKKLQGLVYGKFIIDANPFEGVIQFIQRCRSQHIDVFIISHKTEYGEILEEKINLREAALNWLKAKGFLNPEKSCLDESRIFFEHPREEKLSRINKLQCTHFIDDLEDVLVEPKFPENVVRILFSVNETAVRHKLIPCHCEERFSATKQSFKIEKIASPKKQARNDTLYRTHVKEENFDDKPFIVCRDWGEIEALVFQNGKC